MPLLPATMDDRVTTQHQHTHFMNATTPQQIMQRWQVIQGQLLPKLRQKIGSLTPTLEKRVHLLEWTHIEEFVPSSSYRIGRPLHKLAWLTNAFVAKVVLGLTTTVHLIERFSMDSKQWDGLTLTSDALL